MAHARDLEVRHLPAPLNRMDAQQLVELLAHKGPPWIDDIRQRVRGDLTGAEDHYFVATWQQRLVGHVWYTVAKNNPQLGLVGHVFTHPDARRQGIARRLLQRALDEFRHGGGRVMQLFTSAAATVPFYEQLGFENLFTQTAYHAQDWYMRYPVGIEPELQTWWTVKPDLRSLSDSDMPAYCLLYNSARDLTLKDRAQQLGFGLEAEMTFIQTMTQLRAGRCVCTVLDHGRALAGAATLRAPVFPHQSHIGLFDFYALPHARNQVAELIHHCLGHRATLGLEQVYALTIDPPKEPLLQQAGFRQRAELPRHYRVGQQYYSATLWALD